MDTTGKIVTKPEAMSEYDWTKLTQEQNLISMTDAEFAKISKLPEGVNRRKALERMRATQAHRNRLTAEYKVKVQCNREKAKKARQARKRSK